jgi:hypothetical protein
MRKRTVVTLVVASMLLLAGCSIGGDGSPAATATSSGGGDGGGGTGGTGGTDTPAGQSFSYPAGFDEGGVVNVSAVENGHRSALTATGGFTVDYDATVTTPNATTTVQYDQRVETESREVLRRTNVTSGSLTGLVVRYYADETVYVKSQQPGSEETTYGNQSQSYTLAEFTGVEFVRPAFTDVTFESSEVTTRDGDRVVVYRDATLEAATGLFGSNVNRSDVSDFSATLVVAETGVVRELTYAATVSRGGGDRQVEVTVTVGGIDATTIDEPPWVSRA